MATVVVAEVMEPVPFPYEVVMPEPFPNVSLLNVQPVLPPKVPAPSKRKVPELMLIVPFPVTSPPFIVRSPVPERVPEEAVRSPATVNVALAVTLPAIAKLLNAKVPELVIVPPVIVTVLAEGERLPEEFTVKSLATLKLDPLVTVALAAISNLLKTKVPEFATEEPFFI